MNDFYKEWMSAARDDLDAMSELLRNPNLTNIVAFHAHQCIEKSFKAVIEKHIGSPQKSHNIERLYAEILKHIKLEISEALLEKTNEVYVESRYPGDFGLMPSGKPCLEEAEEFYRFARDIYERINRILGG